MEAAPSLAVAAVVLAAGRSQRMAGGNKLLRDLGGRPMIARTVDGVLDSGAAPVLVVTGQQGAELRAALAGRAVRFVDNPDFAEGLSSSLRAGLRALPPSAAGVLICLGDMPLTSPATLRRLLAAFAPGGARSVWVPVAGGRRGNPVLWERRWFAAIAELRGDQGARSLLLRHPEAVEEVPVEDDGVLTDIDDAKALAAVQEALAPNPAPG
ncbi:molybdenum cofactor cytidylyltransferase [Azospirillaceae bacterium]